MEDNGNLFGQLLGHFVRTESASPSLLALLEQRLIAVIGHEIDAEIVRHSLLDHKSFRRRSSANISNCQPYHSKKKFLAEFDFFDDSESSSQFPTQSPPNNKNRSSLVVQHEIQRISDQLVEHSPALRIFRTETLEECKDLVQNLWKIEQQKDSRRSKKGVSSGIFPPQNHLNGSNGFRPFSPQFLPPTDFAGGERQKSDEDEYEEYDSENEEEDEGGQQHNDVVELSSFSLDHSMQEWPDEEMQNIVWLICSDGMEQSVRLTNIQKLHFVSPVAFSKSKAFEIFLGHLHAVLPLPSLFSETMHILARILNCPNEMLWLKSANCLSRVVHGVIRSSSLGPNDKKSFADFFRQILFNGPQIWRHFEQPTICQIVLDLVEMLTVEISAGGGGGPSPSGFLEMLARVDPEALWLLPWLHRRSILTLMMPKFSELINEILDQHGKEKINGCDGTDEKPRHSPLFWAFEASVLFRCLQHSSVLSFLREIVPDFAELQRSFCRAILHFLTLVFGPLPISAGPRPKGFGMARRIVVKGLLKTTMSDCGAVVLSSLPLFLMPLFAVPSSVSASLVVPMPSLSSSSSFAQVFDLCLKVLLNVLLHAPPSLPSTGDVFAFLAKVEQSLRHHLTLFLHHNDNPFSNELTIQVLNALFEHFPIGQLRTAFSDLIHTLLITNISKLDHSNPNHRRLIVAIAYLTFMDHHNHSQSAYQWNQWRKNTGKMLSRIAMRNYSSICAGGVSPANPSNGWATFPSAIELSESERHLTTNALLQFLGLQLQQEKFGQKPKSVQNCGAKLRPIGGHSRQSAPVSLASVRRPTDDTSPKVTTADSDYSHVSASSLASASSPSIHRLDFLPSVPNDFRPANCHSEPLPDFVFFLVTQSELLVELLRYGQFGHYLLNKFVSFERLKDSGAEHKMVEFVGKMDFLITNFDMLTDLRHFVPNLGARLVELLHKYCSDSSGNLLMSELSRRLCLFFSHSFVAAPSERRFLKFERIGQMHVALANIPQSIYAKLKTSTNGEEGNDEEEEEEDEEEEDGGSEEKEEKEGKTEGKERKKNNRRKRREEEKERKAIATHSNLAKSQKWDNKSSPATEAKGQQKMADRFRHLPTLPVEAAEQWQNDRNHFEPTTVFGRNTRTVSMQLEERDFQFWFAVLPEKDTVATRHALLQILFSSTGDVGKMQQRMRSRPFELLAKFATKFWPMPEQNKMTMKPPPHSEWLSVLADYAHGLALVRGSRAAVRQRIGTVRLLQQNGQSANDWFLAALFLSSGLSAEATSEFCERFLEWRRISSSSAPFSLNVDSVWPMCCSVSSSSFPCRSFSELLALRVFPRVLSLIRRCVAFRPLRAFLCSCRIPSLFHLFLFYTNQAYLGILPFRAVQEYLVVAVLGGPDFQALHFCAVLAHICDSSTRHHSLHFSSKLTSLFLRPIFLADFRFSKYALIEMDDK